jgi:hypothetical protein
MGTLNLTPSQVKFQVECSSSRNDSEDENVVPTNCRHSTRSTHQTNTSPSCPPSQQRKLAAEQDHDTPTVTDENGRMRYRPMSDIPMKDLPETVVETVDENEDDHPERV